MALCDVDEARAAANFKKFDKQPKYKDFRVMLEKEGKNIDAVTIGIPDFMHATVALACMQHGKHVYVEKPLTRTPWEARLLQEAAVKYKVATQMGNQGFSHEVQPRGGRDRLVGRDRRRHRSAHLHHSRHASRPGCRSSRPKRPCPATLDWELWLGGARMRAFSPYYMPYNWRGFLDFGTGQIGNWATHTAGPVQTALQLGAPTSVERVSVDGESNITYPDRATVRLDFPARGGMPPVKVFYHDGAHAERSGCVPRAGHGERDDPAAGQQSGGQGPRPWAARGGGAGRGAALRLRRPRRRAPPRPRQGAGGPGVQVFGEPRRSGAARHSHAATAACSSAPRASWRRASAAKACSCCPRRAGRSTCCRRSC